MMLVLLRSAGWKQTYSRPRTYGPKVEENAIRKIARTHKGEQADLGKCPDEQRIAHFVGKGFTVEWVADYFDVAQSTLYSEYSEALRKGFNDEC